MTDPHTELAKLLGPIVDRIIKIAPAIVEVTEETKAGKAGSATKFAQILHPLASQLIEVSPQIVIAGRACEGGSLN